MILSFLHPFSVSTNNFNIKISLKNGHQYFSMKTGTLFRNGEQVFGFRKPDIKKVKCDSAKIIGGYKTGYKEDSGRFGAGHDRSQWMKHGIKVKTKDDAVDTDEARVENVKQVNGVVLDKGTYI